MNSAAGRNKPEKRFKSQERGVLQGREMICIFNITEKLGKVKTKSVQWQLGHL